MKNLKSLPAMLCIVFVMACSQASVSGQSTDDRNRLATMTAHGLSVRWDVNASYSALTLTVSAPDGQVFRSEFPAGVDPEFRLTDKKGEKLSDGQYTYELRLTPLFSAGVKETLAAARAKGDDEEVVRDLRKRGVLPSQPLVQSGGFQILNGAVVAGGAEEEVARPEKTSSNQQRLPVTTTSTVVNRIQRHHARLFALPDQVIPDDLIVQGSACVGLDCVNGEVFGFDTIRLKENNTRLQFDDTSTTAGFATNNWQIRANNSASGGGSFLAFVDQGATGNSESGTIVLEVDAGAPANSVRVSSTGRVGFRTATPVLDVHTNTSDTPAMRLEQNNSGGFTAQTWDVAGNEANFFVRDVTGGSRLSFRIRPGAPTSSLDIAANGNVGIGTAAPLSRLHVTGKLIGEGSGTGNNAFVDFGKLNTVGSGEIGFQLGRSGLTSGVAVIQGAKEGVGANNLSMQPSGGRVGIGTTAPDQILSVNGEASKVGGGSWATFSDQRLKTIRGQFNSGLKVVMQLQPLRYEYKPNNALGIKSEGQHVGFAAQAVKQIIPEAVITNDSGYMLVNNDPILWTMLNAIKEQQKEIEQLRSEVRQLRRASRRQR